MRQLRAIVGREVGAFFHSAMAPVVLTGFLVLIGVFFLLYLFGYSEMSFNASQSPRSGNYLNLAEGVFQPLVRITSFFVLFLMPALAMRLFAPELKSGRYELIASWPVADQVWVFGKWLSAVVCAAVMILCGAAYLGAVWFLGRPELGPALTAILGEIMLAGCLLGWGLLASSLVGHQMVAYFLAFVMALVLFIVGTLEPFLPGPLGLAAHELSSLTHIESFSRGVLDTRDILYFLLMTAVPLFAAHAVTAGRRLPRGRRLAQWAPAVLAAVLAVMVYALGQYFPATWDLTGNKRYSLAPQSQQILEGLGDDLDQLQERARAGEVGVPRGDLDRVQVYAFYQTLDPARKTIESLLKACAQHSRHFRYQVSDPEIDLELIEKYGVNATRTLVVEVGDRHTSLLQPEESGLLSAVYRLSTGKLARICHLTGHGEHQLTSDERAGYSSYGQLLFDQGYDVRPLGLTAMSRVPESCDVLVVAGPRLEPEPSTLAAVDGHLARGGAVLAMFDPPTPSGWVNWLAGYRAGLTGDVLVDVEQIGAQSGVGARTIFVTDGYSDHEIVSSLQGVVTIFPMAQTLTEVGPPDSTIAGAILLKSSDKTWGESDPETRYFGRPRYDELADAKGPLPFGMVLEARRGEAADAPGRLVILGNAQFLSNAVINQGGNRDLLLNAVGWLAREEALIQIRGFDPLSQPVVLTDEQKEVIGAGALLGWPLLVGSLAVGLMLRHRRERKTD